MEKMGLKFIYAVLLLLPVFSCTDKTMLDEWGSGDGVIGFRATSNSVHARGMPVESADEIPDMGVFAYYTGNGAANNWAAKGTAATPDFMDHVQVTNNGGTWSYAHKTYWPQAIDANVSFFAYSPYASGTNGITVNVTTGIPSITYSVPTDCADQPDLMVSSLRQDLNKTTNGSTPVNFQMKHALTCIGFKATGNGEQITKIKVTDVKANGVLSTDAGGNFTWDLSSATSGDFEATLQGGTYLDTTSQTINSGGGYLMMIPQTLPAGAKLIIGVDDGRTDVEFDLGGITWEAGQRINYGLAIMPGTILLLTPDVLVLPGSGGYSQFNVIESDGSPATWTLSAGENYMYLCDNLPHLQEWASGTRSAGDVRNLDGSTPVAGGNYAGTGSRTLYVWIPSQNPSSSAERTGTISQPGNAAALINVSQLPDVLPSGITNTALAHAFVGAFWRASQKGERIIRLPVTDAANAGAWDASVLWTDDGWVPGEIVFSNAPTEDGGVTYISGTENPADMLNAGNDATYSVAEHFSSAAGTIAAGTGNEIYFRIGLTSAFTPTAERPARYAVVVVRYGSPRKNHLIFLRQGENADYIGRGTGAPKWAVFNVGMTAGTFADYPSQAGFFKRWSTSTNLYAPVGNVVSWPVENTTSIANVCPTGYVIPSADGTMTYSANNQMFSLLPLGGNRSIRGYYADGYFDRREIVASANNEPASAVSRNSPKVAYTGNVIYNITTNASLFLCTPGTRSSTNGELTASGSNGMYWSRSLSPTLNQPYLLLCLPGTMLQSSSSSGDPGLSIRGVLQ